MTLYTVLAPATKAGDTLPTDPLRVVFVKEGIAWPALFFGIVWLIFRRMWLVLAGYVALGLVVSFIDAEIGGALPGIFMLLTHILLALEGNELRRWTLVRAGYRLVDVVEARNLEEAEIRYFAGIDGATPIAVETAVLPTPPVPPAPPSVPSRLGPVTPSAEAGDVVGLFPAPQPWGTRT